VNVVNQSFFEVFLMGRVLRCDFGKMGALCFTKGRKEGAKPRKGKDSNLHELASNSQKTGFSPDGAGILPAVGRR